jgi:hypothetical protein
LFASQFLYPDREDGHSLKSWGIRLGKHKIDYRTVALELGIIQSHESEFCRWSPQMDDYCRQDVDVTEEVFNHLYPQIEVMNAFKLGQKNFFLMKAQEFTGFKFDVAEGHQMKGRIEWMIESLKKSEESYYSIPARPYLKDGKFSSTMETFIERHKAKVISREKIEVDGKVFTIIPGAQVVDGQPMSLSDQIELKDFFLNGVVNNEARKFYTYIQWKK